MAIAWICFGTFVSHVDCSFARCAAVFTAPNSRPRHVNNVERPACWERLEDVAITKATPLRSDSGRALSFHQTFSKGCPQDGGGGDRGANWTAGMRLYFGRSMLSYAGGMRRRLHSRAALRRLVAVPQSGIPVSMCMVSYGRRGESSKRLPPVALRAHAAVSDWPNRVKADVVIVQVRSSLERAVEDAKYLYRSLRLTCDNRGSASIQVRTLTITNAQRSTRCIYLPTPVKRRGDI